MTDKEFKKKVCLITGSSSGIGFSIARRLNNNGYAVVINGQDKTKLIKAQKLLKNSHSVRADVSIESQAKKLVNETLKIFGRIDALICNVGSGASVETGKETYAEWQRVFDKNLWSTTNIVEAACDPLAETKGSIVCISSICGQEYIRGAPITYSVAKAALEAYVQGSSHHLGKRGIRMNAIAPGNILFSGSVWDRKLQENKTFVDQFLLEEVPLGKLGTPDDVASVAEYLISKEASFVTGAVWRVDGGQTRS